MIETKLESIETKFDARLSSMETKFDAKFNSFETKFDSDIKIVKTEIGLIKCMLGFVIAGIISMIIKLFM